MKRFIYSMVALMLSLSISAADKVTEDFSTLTQGDLNGTKELPTGTWSFSSMKYTKSNCVMCLAFSSTSSTVITPAFDKVAKISFGYRAGGSNKNVKISYSTDNGSTWTDVETFVIKSSSSSFASYSKKTGTDELTGVKFRIQGDNNVYMNSFTATFSDGGSSTEPDDPTFITEGFWVPTKAFPTATKEIYISPDGNDNTGEGTIDKPWFDLGKAVNAATPGTHIICRGGTYKQKVQSDGKFTVRIKNSGTAEAPIVIRCYDGEKPVFDFVDGLTKERVGERGILLTGDYWWLFGLHITHAADNGIKLEGSHNRIERCEFSYNFDTGIQLGFGHDFSKSVEQSYGVTVSKNDGSWCSYNDVIDCDSYFNCDYDSNWGSDADGFACKMHNGKGNRFIRCRSWHNGDDGWDLYETDYSVILAECWSWTPAKQSDHEWVKGFVGTSSVGFSGNGNGIKLGGNGTGGSSVGVHYAFNCIAFDCNYGNANKGFDENSHKGGVVLVGCLGFDNAHDYMFEKGEGSNTYFYNNICLGSQEFRSGMHDDYNAIAAAASKNGWTNHLVTGVSKDDFISLDEDDALKPRSVDGRLPLKFGRLASDSKMVDAGNADLDNINNVWQGLVAEFPFLERTVTGKARDLGPYERPASNPTAIETVKTVTKEVKTRKYFMDGQLIIVKDGQRYNSLGQKL